MTTRTVVTGSCACGKVSYEVNGGLRPVVACHCHTCRKTMGHFMAATAAKLNNIEISGHEHLTWYHSSMDAKRGFCRHCGSSLFWQHNGSDQISISAGSVDASTDLEFWGHIYASEKASYYHISKDDIICDGKPDDFPLAPD